MLVWLGNAPDGPTVGATYDPARRAWRRIAPSPIGSREFFSTAWTGRELIMFSGSSGDGLAAPAGAAYDPVSDRWRLLAPAPIAARLDHAAVWTGREVLVWGGRDGRRSFGEGAAYDPRADRWARWPAAADPRWPPPGPEPGCWSGTDPRPAPHRRRLVRPGAGPVDADHPRSGPGCNRSGPVWTGTELVTWNGTGTGAIAYAPAASWSTLPAGPPHRQDL
jgi:hypothetical protein